MEKIIEKMNTIPRLCEDFNEKYSKIPFLQIRDHLDCFTLHTYKLFSDEGFQLTGKRDEVSKTMERVTIALAIFTQLEQKNIFLESALDAMKNYNGCYPRLETNAKFETMMQSLYQSCDIIENISKSITGLEMGLATKMEEISKATTTLADSWTTITKNVAYTQTAKILAQYQNSIEDMFSSIQQLPIDKFEMVCQIGMNFDVGAVSVSEDGTLSYQEITYKKDEVPQELALQVQEVDRNPIPLKQQLEEFKQKHWLLILILSIYVFIPGWKEATVQYLDAGKCIYEMVLNLPQMCYTTREKSYIRSKADAKSKILATLVYDTELEILEDIPRWYKVKYTDETGTEIEGWISKISVEE